MERVLRGVAGAVVLASVGLAYYVHPAWLWLAVFAGANLFQSAFTNWCPMMALLKNFGLK